MAFQGNQKVRREYLYGVGVLLVGAFVITVALASPGNEHWEKLALTAVVVLMSGLVWIVRGMLRGPGSNELR